MKAYRSNTEKESCSPISSNCVVWQGPDLPCLNLCKGDSVSDVVYKLAVEVCDLQANTGLSTVDLTCLVQVCQTTPEPTKTLANILELLINKVCCLSDIVNNIPTPGVPYVEPTLNLPACLQYSNGTGGTVTSLVLSQYVLRIATVLCQINSTVNLHTSQIANHEVRITALENATNPVLQISSCLSGTVEDIDVALENLETQFCAYKTTLGSASNLTVVQSRQCVTGSDVALSTGSPMSSIIGWKNSVANLGDSLQNLWLTVCDIRAAVKSIQDNCCKVTCDDIIIDFDYKWIDAVTLRLFFLPKGNLPMGFYDCNDAQGNMLTFTDGLGNEYYTYIHFRRQDPADLTGVFDDVDILTNGYDIDFTNSPLDTSTGLTVTGNECFTNGSTSCIKCLNKLIAAYVNKDCCTITASSEVTIVYKQCYSPIATTTSTTTTLG